MFYKKLFQAYFGGSRDTETKDNDDSSSDDDAASPLGGGGGCRAQRHIAVHVKSTRG